MAATRGMVSTMFFLGDSHEDLFYSSDSSMESQELQIVQQESPTKRSPPRDAALREQTKSWLFRRPIPPQCRLVGHPSWTNFQAYHGRTKSSDEMKMSVLCKANPFSPSYNPPVLERMNITPEEIKESFKSTVEEKPESVLDFHMQRRAKYEARPAPRHLIKSPFPGHKSVKEDKATGKKEPAEADPSRVELKGDSESQLDEILDALFEQKKHVPMPIKTKSQMEEETDALTAELNELLAEGESVEPTKCANHDEASSVWETETEDDEDEPMPLRKPSNLQTQTPAPRRKRGYGGFIEPTKNYYQAVEWWKNEKGRIPRKRKGEEPLKFSKKPIRTSHTSLLTASLHDSLAPTVRSQITTDAHQRELKVIAQQNRMKNGETAAGALTRHLEGLKISLDDLPSAFSDSDTEVED